MNYSSYIKDGMLCWTLTSNGYKYMTWNFVNLWKRAGCSAPICVLCADKASYQFLKREGISCLYTGDVNDFGTSIVPFGSRQFSYLNRLKLKYLHMFAMDPSIQHTLYIDGDIAIYKDIVADIRSRLQDNSFVAQCDEKSPTCSNPDHCPNLCTGLLAWTHGADKGCFYVSSSDEHVQEWQRQPEDQVWVNTQLRSLTIPVKSLPRDLYPNGARCTLTKTTPSLREAALCLHYNYRVGAVKQQDMKRFGDWTLPY